MSFFTGTWGFSSVPGMDGIIFLGQVVVGYVVSINMPIVFVGRWFVLGLACVDCGFLLSCMFLCVFHFFHHLVLIGNVLGRRGFRRCLVLMYSIIYICTGFLLVVCSGWSSGIFYLFGFPLFRYRCLFCCFTSVSLCISVLRSYFSTFMRWFRNNFYSISPFLMHHSEMVSFLLNSCKIL